MRVQVVGAGVIGLTTAIRALEAGHDVEVVAAARTPNTTSDVAGALHMPFLAEPRDRVEAWADETLRVLRAQADDASAGVREIDVLEHEAMEADATTVWSTVLIDMRRYLPWLEHRIKTLGGQFRSERLTAIPPGPAIVCAGLGARAIVPDASVRPVFGQVAYVADPGLRSARLHQGGDTVTYLFPHGDRVVLGGTMDADADPGGQSPGEPGPAAPDPAVRDSILARTSRLEPQLRGARPIGEAVAARPYRSTVRVEASRSRPGVVYNYGHGGSGVTLCWGCADEAVSLL